MKTLFSLIKGIILWAKSLFVKPEPKKIKRWLWADKYGCITDSFFTEQGIEATNNHLNTKFTIKLLWSETEFEEIE